MYDLKHVKAKVIEGPSQKDVVAAILGWMQSEPPINVLTILFHVKEVAVVHDSSTRLGQVVDLDKATVFYEPLE